MTNQKEEIKELKLLLGEAYNRMEVVLDNYEDYDTTIFKGLDKLFADVRETLYKIDGVMMREETLSFHPSDIDTHYQTDIQPIEVMQSNMTKDEFIGFLKGNIIKYVCRCGRKDAPSKEAAKIQQYSKWLVEALEGRIIDPKI